MSCFRQKMLVVDLTNNTIEARRIPKRWVDLYLGQKGLGTRIFMEDVSYAVDPLSPENELVFTNGIMTGTIVSCTSKLAITSKSPLTGTITDGSVGGHAGAELKYAGYDALVVKGRAASLKYIYIDPDKAEIRDASFLKGGGTFTADKLIKEKVGEDQIKILAIGPAGENMVPFACVSSERYRQLGRGGIGAVIGSKNLKAVAIRGWMDVKVKDIQKCMQIAAESHKADGILESEYMLYKYGTPALVDFSQRSGLLPTRNFQEGTFEHAENINGEALKTLRQQKKACFACGISCGNFVRAGGSQVEGPEYETIALCGSNLLNQDPEKLIKFNALCDDLGMDTISTGSVLACMMEMTDRGVHDFGIRFGEIDKALSLLPAIAQKKGLGAEAALGARTLARKYGGEQYAMQVKGMDLPGYDPRGSWGMGLGFVTSPRGGCHMTAYTVEDEAWGNIDPFTFEGKARLVIDRQDKQFAKFSMGVCDFWALKTETLGRLFEVTYGGKWPEDKVIKAGERIFNLQRMFNVMAGFIRKDDYLPERFYREVLKAGPPKDIPMTKAAFDKALDEYYALRGWDAQGRPKPKKLKELGIETELIERYRKATGL